MSRTRFASAPPVPLNSPASPIPVRVDDLLDGLPENLDRAEQSERLERDGALESLRGDEERAGRGHTVEFRQRREVPGIPGATLGRGTLDARRVSDEGTRIADRDGGIATARRRELNVGGDPSDDALAYLLPGRPRHPVTEQGEVLDLKGDPAIEAAQQRRLQRGGEVALALVLTHRPDLVRVVVRGPVDRALPHREAERRLHPRHHLPEVVRRPVQVPMPLSMKLLPLR